MDALRGLWRRLRSMLFDRARSELDDELSFHTAMEASRLEAEGVPAAAARREALLRFGGVERHREAALDARGFGWFDALRQDLRHALRLLRRDPGFATAAVLTLGLGIGVTTAIFTVVDTVLFRALPFPEPDRLVVVWETDRASGTRHEPASWPDIVDLRERSRRLEAVGALTAVAGTLGGAGEPERVSVLGVTPDVLDVFGIQPLLGRVFEAGEGPLDGPFVALLGEAYWRGRFGADPDVVGSTVQVNGRSTQIIGVLPQDADLGIAQLHARADYGTPLAGIGVDIWIAVEPTAAAFPRQTHPFFAVARLVSGATLASAQDELAGIMAELETAYPENAARGVNVQPWGDVAFGTVRAALIALLGAVGLVLLIACVNVANLLLARTAARTRELAVRRALGAAPARVRRQLLTESVVLAAIGAAVGLAFAQLSVRALVTLAPAEIPRLAGATLDPRVLAFTTVITVAAVLLFGFAPALRSRGRGLQGALRAQPGRRVTEAREHRRFRRGLVVAEVALAVTLVTSAGLLLRSFDKLLRVDPGFHTEGVVKAQYELPTSRYPLDFSRWPDLHEINGFHARLLERVRALPGVREAALAARHPLDAGFTNSFVIVGREAESADFPEIRTRFITPGYLRTMAVPLIAGRDIDDADIAGTPPVALLNRAAAERYFSGADPIGSELRFWGTNWRIVGIMGDERFRGIDEPAEAAIYTPLAQAPQSSATLLVRAAGDPQALVGALRSAITSLDPELAPHGIETLDVTLARSIARPRFTATLGTLFAAAALILALIGVHGVLAYDVAQRTGEVGIRMALGATRAQVYRMVIRDGVAPAAIGVVIGIAGALIAARATASLLFGVAPHDPLTFGGVALVTIAMAVLACWLPARRAAAGQPMEALRTD